MKWPFVSRKKYENLLESIKKPNKTVCSYHCWDICDVTAEVLVPKAFSEIDDIELAEAKRQLFEEIKEEIMGHDSLYLLNIESHQDNSGTKIRMHVNIMSYGDDKSSY